jgi:hypothetical protein
MPEVQRGFLMAKRTPRRKKPGNDTQLWRMRWFLLVLLTITLLVSIAAVMITQNALLIGLSGSLLTVIGFIVRWLFPRNEADRAVEGKRLTSQRAHTPGKREKPNTAAQDSRPDPRAADE